MHFGQNNRVKMLASKPVLPSSNLRLPTVKKPIRRSFQSTPDSSIPSMASPTISENVSALKAKYSDYAMWLKASSRQNREPVFTHELLKHSLCQMGLDSTQAEQLVSTCSWYVYQFHKELGAEIEQINQSATTETKKTQQTSTERHKKTRSSRSKNRIASRDHSSDSTRTLASAQKENSTPSGSSSPIRNKFSVLPSIPTSDPPTSPRPRHVDFDKDQSPEKEKSSHWQSAVSKVRILPKLRPTGSELSVNHNPNDGDGTPDLALQDLDSHTTHHPGAPRTRSILRKPTSSCSSEISEVVNRRNRSRRLTPVSPIVDEIPLGTKSQRLFGGSKCFAEIMNELEEQKQS